MSATITQRTFSNREHIIIVDSAERTYENTYPEFTSFTSKANEIDPGTAKRFARLAKAWRSQKGPISSISRKSMLQPYQSIIGLGPSVIPLLLNELQNEPPDHWFWALEHLTEENPIPESDRGNMAKMAEAWVRWGKLKGYL